MAAMQLREFGEIEPDLISYLAKVLLDVVQHPASEAARHLNIAPPDQPANRPPDDARIMSMLLCWEIVCLNPALDRGDAEHLRLEATRIMKIADEAERQAQLVDLGHEIDDSHRKRSRTEPATFELAASLFNSFLEQAQADGRRLNEKPVGGGAIRSAIYRCRKEFSEVPE